MMRNSMDVDEHLIEEVRNRTILFDMGHTNYKNLKKKEQEWREVAPIVKLNELDCKKSWKVLRDSYKRCKRMEQVASGSGANIPKKKWKYFDAMSFLDNFTNSMPNVGNILNDVSMNSEKLIDMDLNESSNFPSECVIESPREKKKKDSENFKEFVDLAASSISESCGAFAAASKTEDSISAHFITLAAKINEANMPKKYCKPNRK